MIPATLMWGLLAGALAIAVVGGVWWRGQRRAAAARAQAQQAAQQAALMAAQQAAQQAARQAAEQTATATQAAARLRAGQAERAAQQHARAEAERAAAAEQAASAARAAALREAAAPAAAASAATAATATVPRGAGDILVLVADDSKVVRIKTSRLLTQHGYRVVLAEDGAQAALLIEAEVPAVLVTDVEMPGLDGLALTRHVRAHPRAGRIPIIMITSADDRLKAAAAEAGVTLVLGKPYPEDELIACIERSQAAATV